MAHLSICGEFITDYVRGLVLEGNPEKAWTILEECLLSEEGEVPHSVLVSILNGSSKLEGVNDISLVEEQDEEYRSELLQTYAGRIQLDGMWYRPILIIPSYSASAFSTVSRFPSLIRAVQSDRHIFTNEVGEVEPWVVEWEGLVAQWHVSRLRGHVRVEEALGFFVLWDVCPGRPFWLKGAPKTFEAALVEFLGNEKTVPVADENDLLSFYEDLNRSNFYAEEQFDQWDLLTLTQKLVEFDQWDLLTLTQKLVGRRKSQKKYEELCLLQEEIKRRSGSDTLELRVYSEVYHLPRAPFINWALSRTKFGHLAPKWEVVCPIGMKMDNDNRYHTDWMVGAGIPLHKSYDRELLLAAADLSAQIQEELCGTSAHILTGADGYHQGAVGKSIMVLPHLGVEYAEVAMNPEVRVIIAEEGGALSHLVSVGRESGLCILRIKNALSLFPLGTTLGVNQETGKVSML